MTRAWTGWGAALLGLGVALGARAGTMELPRPYENVVRSVGPGTVDWSELRLTVDSRSDRRVGAWKDRRVQEQDALDSLGPRMASAARRLPVTSESSAGDLFGGGEVGERLEAGSKAWQVEETRYHQGGGVEMTATLDLRSWVFPALATLTTAQRPTLSLGETDPTGVVVDARGLPFEPSLVPTVVTADERPLVRAQLLAPAADARAAPVVYVTDPADPRASKRVGNRPVFARAESARGSLLVLGPGSTLGEVPQLPALVAARRLVVVVDP